MAKRIHTFEIIVVHADVMFIFLFSTRRTKKNNLRRCKISFLWVSTKMQSKQHLTYKSLHFGVFRLLFCDDHMNLMRYALICRSCYAIRWPSLFLSLLSLNMFVLSKQTQSVNNNMTRFKFRFGCTDREKKTFILQNVSVPFEYAYTCSWTLTSS